MDASSPIINQCRIVMRKAIEEIRRSHSSRQVNNALNTQNGPSIDLIHDSPLNSPVLIFCKINAGQSG